MSVSSFREATSMSTTSDFAKSSPTQFSAAATEFVPSFLMAEESQQFYDATDGSSYAMDNTYQYNAYALENQAYSYPQCNNTQNYNNVLLSLDAYSDESSEDEQPTPCAKPAMPNPEEVAPKEPQPVEPSMDATSPNGSTDVPEFDTCSLGLDSFDNEPDDFQDAQNEESASFSVDALLHFRHAVPWSEGAEEGLSAEQMPELSETTTEQAPKAESEKQVQKPKESAISRLSRIAEISKRERPATNQQQKGDKDKGTPAKTLHMSDSSWLAQQKALRQEKAGNGTDSLSHAEVVRSMKSILNKLTIEKFEPLYAKLVSCGIQTTAHLQALIHEVFEKATMQHHFCNMYADLCARLHKHFSEHPITDDPKMTFKKILLNGCQAFFEKHLKPPDNLDDLDEEERVVLTCKYKTQMLGNIKFVGALLVRQMLATKVLFAICEELLGSPTPETLESVAALLTVVGPTFDVSGSTVQPMLTDVFNRIKVLVEKKEINCRVRCLLKDVLELRAAKWQDRKPKKIEGPSTLKAVADTQAAEEKNSCGSNKTPSKNTKPFQGKTWPGQGQAGNGKSWPGQGQAATGKSWPGQGQGQVSSPKKQPPSSLASDLFSQNAPSPKDSPPSEGYARINSLAALKGGRKDVKASGDERPRKQPCEEPVDKEACREEVAGALAELRLTHEVNEALLRISSLSVPSSKQSEELCDMLAHMAEEGSQAARRASFELVVALFTQGHWKSQALGRGLQEFVEEVCPDLKCDIPLLPKIMREELSPALAPLVKSGTLQQSQHDALAVC